MRHFRSLLSSLRRNGRGRIIDLSGEPGSGKTSLLAEVSREARSLGIPTLSGCCAEAEQRLPYRAFTAVTGSSLMVRALQELKETNPDLLGIALKGRLAAPGGPGFNPSSEQRSAVQLAARYLLMACARDGLVLMLDDFHWADPLSAELVEYFVRYPIDAPLLLVIAHRPRQTSRQLRGALAHGAEMRTVECLRLWPLSAEQSAEVLGAPPGDPRLPMLHRESGGNPMYLRALAGIAERAEGVGPSAPGDAVSTEHPLSSHAAAILRETASLAPEESAVLSAIAVLGDGFDQAALADVAGVSVEETLTAIDRLTVRDLLKPVDWETSIALRHPALRHLIYSHTVHSWRVQAHRRAIGVLNRRGAAAADIARHVQASPDTSSEGDIRVLERAARDELWSAPEHSVTWLRTALRTLRESGRDDPDLDLRLSLTLARALVYSGKLADGCRLLQSQAPRLSAQPARVRAPAVALHALAECLLDHPAQAHALLVHELAGAGDGSPVEVLELYVVQLLVGVLSGTPPRPERMETAVRIAVAHQDRPAEAGALALLGLCQVFAGEAEAAAGTLTASATLVDGFSERALGRNPEYLAVLGRGELLIGRFAEAKRHFEHGVALLRLSGHSHLLPLMLTGLAAACMRVGPLGEMRLAAAEAEEIALRTGSERLSAVALSLRSVAASLSGTEEDTAVEATRQAPPSTSPMRWGAEAGLVFAHLQRTGGDPHGCLTSIVNSCGGPGLRALPPVLRAACFEMLTDAAVEAGEPAAEWSASAVSIANRLPGAFSTPYAAAARAHLLRGRGAHGHAAEGYSEAAAQFHRARLAGDEMRMLALGGACSAAAGQHAQAARTLAAAERLAREFGALRLYENLRRTCEGPREEAAEPGGGLLAPEQALSMLTNREREVAGLASIGHRTRDIAKELGLSPKTVDVHLSRIYRKLNVCSRTELAWLVAELGGLPMGLS
jgi:DNA-binding CsgD family transcriptional regulator